MSFRKTNLEFYKETSFSKSSEQHLSKQCEITVDLDEENNAKNDNTETEEDGQENLFISIYKLFRYSDKMDKWLMVIGSIVALFDGLSMPFIAAVMGKITDIFANVSTQGFQSERNSYDVYDNYSNKISNHSLIGSDREMFFHFMSNVALTYLSVSALTFTLISLQVFCWEMSAERQVYKLRKVFLSQILRQDSSWYDLNTEGDISQKLSDDIERIREGIGSKISFLLTYSSTFTFGILVGFMANVKLTLVLLISAPVVIGLQAVGAKMFFKSSAREQLRYGVAGGVASEVLNCIKLVASFSGETRELKRYSEAMEEGSKLALKKYYKVAIISALNFIATYLTFAGGFRYSAYLVKIGEATPGEVFTVFLSVMVGAFSVGNALPYINMVFTAVGSASNIYAVIDRVPTIDPYSTTGSCIENLSGDIDFENVNFSYPSRSQIQVLKGLTLRIESGKRIAVVGPSGSGKSTLINLILRFYDPSSGKVCLDGVNISTLNLSWLRGRIGLVSQEPVLFGVSIAENIRYGHDHVTMEDIMRASQLANAHSFIQFLPKGYETEVGSRGTMLSGGQKQRIAIARALVRDPKILLLDEATSALDTESESIVQEALDRAMSGRTTVIIAHRLSTIKNADLIVTMKDGRVHESGTHEELMALRGLYNSLVTTQMRQDDAEVQPEISGDEEEEILPQIQQRDGSSRKSLTHYIKRTFTMGSRKSSVASIKAPSLSDEKTKIKMLADKVSFIKILSMTKGQLWYLVLALAGSILLGIVLPINASFYGDIFETFMLKGEKYDSAVTYWTCIFLLTTALTGIGIYTQVICFSILTEKIIIKLRESAFRSLLSQQCSWFDQPDHTPGKLITSLSRDPPLIKTAAGFRAGQVVIAITIIVTALVVAFISLWKLALVLCIVVPLITIANFKEIQLIKKHQERDSKLMDAAGQVSSEGIRSLKTVQALGKEKLFLERYSDNLKLPYKEGKLQSIWYSLTYGISHALLYIMYASGFLSGAYFMLHDKSIRPSQIFKAFFALNYCAVSLGQTASYIQEFYKAKLSIAFIYELIEQFSDKGALSDSGLTPEEVKGDVEFVGVEFRYPSRKEAKILRGINLKIPQGTTIALVGRSGCGKSTVMSLLQRFYSPTRGKILLDGIDIAEMNVKWLRQHLGVVTQEPVLLATSIKENIAYGALNPDSVTLEHIIEAAKTANIHQFIAALPKGYDTEVGDMGAQLSGGQKQRIAIARAILRKPKILLLDEATSALDTESEKVVQEALEKARAGRTCIIIAHRLSTIRNADLIAVIQHGRVIEQGTHVQLSQSSGFYSQLVQHSQI